MVLDLRQAVKLFGAGNLILDYKTLLAGLHAKKSAAMKVIELFESRCEMIED